jgi:hypothetical protein
MGGIGSGRRAGSGRETVDSCRSLDVNRLHRAGCLRPGWHGGWQWTVDGKRVAWIGLHAEECRLHLSYRVRLWGGDWESIEETVRLVWAGCPFGGERPYFACPGLVNGISCGRRVAKLYGPGRYFLCRHCYGLAYGSQSESRWDRTLRRANKLRRKLGGEPGMQAPLPPRPKGMWSRTYSLLLDRLFETEDAADEAFVAHTSRLLAHLNRRDGFKR